MTQNTSLSFTATILVNGFPLLVLNDAADKAVVVPHVDSNLGQMNISRGLGMLGTPDEVWDDARQRALIDFHVTGQTSPAVFHFRHTDEGYQLSLRSGGSSGQAVVKNRFGIPKVKPVEEASPSSWHMRLAHTGELATLSDLATETAVINLECADSHKPVTTHLIARGEGGYLITHGSALATSLRLNILERGVE
ncbi:hypothetical protein [Pseudomonas guariconensis]|uniref:hypothetical protein n=1 Tax=Pseudomonas guariconensis TaxID=1288410 RepID=UPI0018A90D6D|nr:hypothetical protein [Pseudomonas guariconensis]MBF8758063.1 hypothetical protein [Pseudomonas guariconensis]